MLTNYQDILNQIDQIDPIKYGKTRNYLNGAVTRLSPYISRGVISTKQVSQSVLRKGYSPKEIDSFLKELAWRDYFQLVWQVLKSKINEDVKQSQSNVSNNQIPLGIINAQTGIEAIDNGINELYETGYMHNHLRMYVASICCNVAQCHWQQSAKWMYYHLLDADWASNALSWQWVGGSFSQKKYYANQENINKYCNTNQHHTFLDHSYEVLPNLEIPEILKATNDFDLKTILPKSDALTIQASLPIYIYNFYNLDPMWDEQVNANRILLLEPEHFKAYPVSEKTIQFVLELSKNINNCKVFVGSYESLYHEYPNHSYHYKEHPLNEHYKGIQHQRDWMFEDVKGYFSSFFSFWKQAEKQFKTHPKQTQNESLKL
jgi:deoxyribodipyrimidine photo-lyase